jgi:hypothetical protein
VIGFLPLGAPGAAAELVLASVDGLTAAPSSIALSDAAALPLVGLTAWQSLLAKGAGTQVVATAGPRSIERVRSAGADELAALALPVRPGGVVVNTTVWMPAPSDTVRDVRGIDAYVRSDAEQLSHLVELVDGERLTPRARQRDRSTC